MSRRRLPRAVRRSSLLTAVKDRQQAALLDFSWPTSSFLFVQNIIEVIKARDYMLITAFINSTILTVASVAIMVVLARDGRLRAAAAASRWNRVVNFLVLSGLIIPPAVVPDDLGAAGARAVQDDARADPDRDRVRAVVLHPAVPGVHRHHPAGARRGGDHRRRRPLRLFFRVIFPLLRPVVVTVIVVQSVVVFNDFTNPLYFLPGDENATVQLTLFNFQSQFSTQYNLLFMDILLITIPPLMMFMFFNRQIVAGMTAGAVKG